MMRPEEDPVITSVLALCLREPHAAEIGTSPDLDKAL
jgi:hypothetical protein